MALAKEHAGYLFMFATVGCHPMQFNEFSEDPDSLLPLIRTTGARLWRWGVTGWTTTGQSSARRTCSKGMLSFIYFLVLFTKNIF